MTPGGMWPERRTVVGEVEGEEQAVVDGAEGVGVWAGESVAVEAEEGWG